MALKLERSYLTPENLDGSFFICEMQIMIFSSWDVHEDKGMQRDWFM